MNDERGALVAAARVLKSPLGDDDVDRLLRYLTLLRKWNRVYNLTAVRDPAAMLTHHLFDSLAVVAPLRREVARLAGAPVNVSNARLLDVGSGAGLPGIVIAVCCPTIDVHCIDAVGKKAAFVRQMAAELSLPNLHAIHGRVEAQPDAATGGAFNVITARAFASLADLVGLSRRALASDGIWLAMKGKTPTDEIAALPESVEMFHVEPLTVPALDAERCIVWLRNRLPID